MTPGEGQKTMEDKVERKEDTQIVNVETRGEFGPSPRDQVTSRLGDLADIGVLPPEGQRRLKILQHASTFMEKNPEEAAGIITAWIRGDRLKPEEPADEKSDHGEYPTTEEPETARIIPRTAQGDAISWEDVRTAMESVHTCVREGKTKEAVAHLLKNFDGSLVDEVLSNPGNIELKARLCDAELDESIIEWMMDHDSAKMKAYVVQRAYQGCIEAGKILVQRAARGDGYAASAIIHANLCEDIPANLWWSDARIISRISCHVREEHPESGPITNYIKRLIRDHYYDFVGFLLDVLIRYHNVSLVYQSPTDAFPSLLIHNHEKGSETDRSNTSDVEYQSTSETASHFDDGTREENRNENLSLEDISRVIAMLYIYRPEETCRCFGSVYDERAGGISPLFASWTEDPIVASAFCRQAETGSPMNRKRVLELVQESIDTEMIDLSRFNYRHLPGFVYDIVATLARGNEKARSLLQHFSEDKSDGQ